MGKTGPRWSRSGGWAGGTTKFMSEGNSEMSKNSESSHQVGSILKVRKEKSFEALENLKNLGILRKKGKYENGEDNEQVKQLGNWRGSMLY